jgi:hypothetical protein
LPFSLPARRRRSAHRASSCKEMQANPRKKAFISFHFLCRFEAFQWVTANPNKNFPSSIFRLAKRPNCPPSAALQKGRAPDRRRIRRIAQILNFEKESLRGVRLQPAGRETNSGTGRSDAQVRRGSFCPTLGRIGTGEGRARAPKSTGYAPQKPRELINTCAFSPIFARLRLKTKPNQSWRPSAPRRTLRGRGDFMAPEPSLWQS